MFNKHPRTVIIVQARMGSTRLPGKILKEVLNRPILSYLIERLQRCKNADALLVATTTNPFDDQIVDCCKKNKVAFMRGSEEDVLARYYDAALSTEADVVVRVTSDCPLIDPTVIDSAIENFLSRYPEQDYLSNTLERTYPRGMDVEVFSFNALKEAFIHAQDPEQREHVTPFIYLRPDRFKLRQIKWEEDESIYRWTVDTEEDFQLIRQLLEVLYPRNPEFGLRDIIRVMQDHPDWLQINAHVLQKQLKGSASV